MTTGHCGKTASSKFDWLTKFYICAKFHADIQKCVRQVPIEMLKIPNRNAVHHGAKIFVTIFSVITYAIYFMLVSTFE